MRKIWVGSALGQLGLGRKNRWFSDVQRVRVGLWSVLCLAAAAFGSANAANSEIKVAATTKPVHSLVAQVMEGYGTPLLIVEGAASAHTFTLKPSTARALDETDFLIRVSEETEPFTRKLVAALPERVRVITLAAPGTGVELLDRRSGAAFEPHEHGGDGEADADAPGDDKSSAKDADHVDTHDDARSIKDGHVWLDPENAKAILATVARELSARAPATAELFQANAAKSAAAIDALDAAMKLELAGTGGQAVVVFHDAYQYFEKHFGLRVLGSVTLSPDQQPSARRLSSIRQKLKELEVRCVFAEPGFQPKLLAAVTEGSAAKTGELDPEGQSLTPGPQLYSQLMLGLARSVRTCLGSR